MDDFANIGKIVERSAMVYVLGDLYILVYI
jgi:hypothetical protein